MTKTMGSYSSVERDAYRYVEAELNWGKGAGIRRRNIKTELSSKMQDPAYKAAFDDAVANIDREKVLRKIAAMKDFEKTVQVANKSYRTARRFGNFYYRNESWLEPIIKPILRLIFGGGNGR